MRPTTRTLGVAEIAIYKAYTKYADKLCFERYGLPYKDMELEILKRDREAEDKVEIDKETEAAKGGLIGAAMVSDAFFPFRDGVDVGIRQGISAIAHAGGSMRDHESIEACNEFICSGDIPETEIEHALSTLEKELNRTLGKDLQLSVRSSAPISMPGMMDTLLNLKDLTGVKKAV